MGEPAAREAHPSAGALQKSEGRIKGGPAYPAPLDVFLAVPGDGDAGEQVLAVLVAVDLPALGEGAASAVLRGEGAVELGVLVGVVVADEHAALGVEAGRRVPDVGD